MTLRLRRIGRGLNVIGPALVLAAIVASGCTRRPEGSNLLLVTLDTTRADRFGFAGFEKARTPRFDAFARQRAVVFENAMSTVPLTLPSHTSIMTGTYPAYHGVHDNDGYRVDDGVTTLAELLSAAGFSTGAHIAAFPLDRRFNLNQGFATYNDDFTEDWTEQERAARTALAFGFLERKADRVNRAVFRWLDDHGDERFFLWVHYFDAHEPYNAPPPYDSLFGTSPYDGEIAFVDEQFGHLLDALDARGLLDETVVMVVGDHGEALREHGEPTHGTYLYDATLRVPMLVANPDRRWAGRRVAEQVRTIDLAPTALDLLGRPVGGAMQGSSLVPLLDGTATAWPEQAMLESYLPQLHFGWAPLRALRLADWKYIQAPKPELYHLATDPGELHNVVLREPARARALEERLLRHARTLAASDPARSTVARVDTETRQKLLALGYVTGSSRAQRGQSYPSPAALRSMINPLDRIKALQFHNLAREMMRTRRFGEAVSVTRQGLRLDPTHPPLQFLFAAAQAEVGNSERALQEMRRAAALMPGAARPHVAAAKIHFDRGEPAQTVAELAIAHDFEAPSAATLELLASAYLRLGEDLQAIDVLEKLLELDASHLQGHLDLADARARQGQTGKARALFDRALRLAPYAPAALTRRGLFSLHLGDVEAAVPDIERALEIDGKFLPAHLAWAEAAAAAGDLDGARKRLRYLLSEKPGAALAERARRLIAELGANG